jgi:hypothetical protein
MPSNITLDNDEYDSDRSTDTGVHISPHEDLEGALSSSSDDARTPRQGHRGPTKKPSYERVRPSTQTTYEYPPEPPSQPVVEPNISNPRPPRYYPHQPPLAYPPPMYSYPGQPYPAPFPPYYLFQPSQFHGANSINYGKGVPRYVNLRNFREEVPNREREEILPLSTKTFSFFNPQDPAPLRECHTVRQARCVSGLEEGDHDIAVLITEDNGILEEQEQVKSSSTWMYESASLSVSRPHLLN